VTGVRANGLSWTAIVRLGVAQACLGAIVVLATSTFNRVMVVELALPASVPGALVALHYAMQALRPRLGHGADAGGRCTPWIVGGMAVLAAGAILASAATAWMGEAPGRGFVLAAAAFVLIGLGVGAAGTSLLVLLATRTSEERRPAAATIVWILMIAGFAISAGSAGRWLDPYTPSRLIAVTACVAAIAFALSALAVRGIERAAPRARTDAPRGDHPPFRVALAQVWSEPASRRLAVFIFVSMLAYGSQDLILEPFAGAVFGLTPGQSTSLAGLQHGGTLVGMIAIGLAATLMSGRAAGSLRGWTIAGCLASAAALAALAAGGIAGPTWPLAATVAALGVANGAYAIAAVGLMLSLVGAGRESREGVRMGVWGAAQAVAFGSGGLAGAVAVDLARLALGSPASAYVAVFAVEAVLFVVSAWLASRISTGAAAAAPTSMRGAPAPAH
jgi:BCD family chlorophyll transporter-like MFS transporter